MTRTYISVKSMRVMLTVAHGRIGHYSRNFFFKTVGKIPGRSFAGQREWRIGYLCGRAVGVEWA